MAITPDTDLRTAIHSISSPVHAVPVLQYLSGSVSSLSAAWFAEIYPALEQAMLSKEEKDSLQIAALVISQVNPPIDLTQIQSISPISPSESTEMRASAEADQLLGEFTKCCTISTNDGIESTGLRPQA